MIPLQLDDVALVVGAVHLGLVAAGDPFQFEIAIQWRKDLIGVNDHRFFSARFRLPFDPSTRPSTLRRAQGWQAQDAQRPRNTYSLDELPNAQVARTGWPSAESSACTAARAAPQSCPSQTEQPAPARRLLVARAAWCHALAARSPRPAPAHRPAASAGRSRHPRRDARQMQT